MHRVSPTTDLHLDVVPGLTHLERFNRQLDLCAKRFDEKKGPTKLRPEILCQRLRTPPPSRGGTKEGPTVPRPDERGWHIGAKYYKAPEEWAEK